MARTTLSIDDPVLAEAKRVQEREGKSLGGVVTELLAEALDHRRRRSGEVEPALQWTAKSMGERVPLTDKDALYSALSEETD